MRITVITSNPGKVVEFQAAFSGLGISVSHERVPYSEVQADSLREVVECGMAELRGKGMRNFIIDDSGMFVNALGGFPGVYSSYVQKTVGNDGILRLLTEGMPRDASFRCCIGCDVGGETFIGEGECKGTILNKPVGSGGFGYDPIFSVDGRESFAEMPLEAKNRVSHRGLAVSDLISKLRERLR